MPLNTCRAPQGSLVTTPPSRLVEKSFREGRAIDLEALCVLAGKKVWSLRVDVHVIDHDGNVSDAASLAALGAMSIFRYPIVEIKVRGGWGDVEVSCDSILSPCACNVGSYTYYCYARTQIKFVSKVQYMHA